MSEINEAYEVLSDRDKRHCYDAARDAAGSGAYGDGDQSVQDAFEQASMLLGRRWRTAVEYYPGVEETLTKLRQTSFRLAFAFQTALLETKRFDEASHIAEQLEQEFLQTYFGTNPHIIACAKELITRRHRDAAKDLNEAIAVLGSGGDPDIIIGKILKKHGLWHIDSNALKLRPI